MFTLVLATPRSGSNSFAYSLDEPVWAPQHHPGESSYEYYNFRHLPSDVADALRLKYHIILKEHLKNNPHKHTIIKVLLGQVNNYILNDLVTHADKIYHTVRLNYQDQLKSFVAAFYQDIWLDSRHSYEKIPVTQQHVNDIHTELTTGIKEHAKVYHRHGGTVVTLESRTQSPYKFKPIFDQTIEWPDFDTARLFDININSLTTTTY